MERQGFRGLDNQVKLDRLRNVLDYRTGGAVTEEVMREIFKRVNLNYQYRVITIFDDKKFEEYLRESYHVYINPRNRIKQTYRKIFEWVYACSAVLLGKDEVVGVITEQEKEAKSHTGNTGSIVRREINALITLEHYQEFRDKEIIESKYTNNIVIYVPTKLQIKAS